MCGYKNKAIKDLKIRVWECPKCGAVHNRDENAIKNMLIQGLLQLGIAVDAYEQVGLGRSKPSKAMPVENGPPPFRSDRRVLPRKHPDCIP